MTQIKIKRVYEDPEAEDGYRVLVDRLWPRGMKKEYLKSLKRQKKIIVCCFLTRQILFLQSVLKYLIPMIVMPMDRQLICFRKWKNMME